MLESENVNYTLIEHEAVYKIGDGEKIILPKSELIAKNLFLCDDRQENYYLVLLEKNKRLDLKFLKKYFGSRRLTFTKDEDLKEILGLDKGMVTPFGIWNGSADKVKVFIDTAFCKKEIGIHANDNTATVWLDAGMLLYLIRQHGNIADWIEI